MVRHRGMPTIQWVWFFGGSFQMGSNNGAIDEKPVHSVRVPDFELRKTEVTVGQHRKCVEPVPTATGTSLVGKTTRSIAVGRSGLPEAGCFLG